MNYITSTLAIVAAIVTASVALAATGPAPPSNVSVAVTGTSATVVWTPPTKNADGSALTGLSGYNMYLASTDAALSALTAASTPKVDGSILKPWTLTSYTLNGLAAGTYYLDMTSWYCSGATCAPVSPFSNHVSFTVGGGSNSSSGTPVSVVGTANFSWIAPTQNTDGSPLTDLDHYVVYRGTSASNLVSLQSVAADVTTFSDSGLPMGTYYYAFTSVNKLGVESDKSVTSSVVFEPPKTPNAPGQLTSTCTVVTPAGMKGTCTVEPK